MVCRLRRFLVRSQRELFGAAANRVSTLVFVATEPELQNEPASIRLDQTEVTSYVKLGTESNTMNLPGADRTRRRRPRIRTNQRRSQQQAGRQKQAAIGTTR